MKTICDKCKTIFDGTTIPRHDCTVIRRKLKDLEIVEGIKYISVQYPNGNIIFEPKKT